MECREVREYLPAYVEQAFGPRAATVDTHLDSCPGCRRELEQYRELGAEMKSLADHQVEPPAWLLGTLIETVSERATRISENRARREQLTDPKVIAGGAVVAAGIAGALLMRGRKRRRRGMTRRLREVLA